jgi:hypothetical protein
MNVCWAKPVWLRPAFLSLVCLGTSWVLPITSNAVAQSVTTAAIRGTVKSTEKSDVDGARVSVLNLATGFSVHGEVRHGRFLMTRGDGSGVSQRVLLSGQPASIAPQASRCLGAHAQ